MIRLVLPWPPSGNKLWRHLKQRRKPVLSRDGKAYYLAIKSLVARARTRGELPKRPLAEACQVRMRYYPPDRRKRDAGNCEKTVYDALTKSGVWVDDMQGNDLDRKWLEPEKPGRVEIEIEAKA